MGKAKASNKGKNNAHIWDIQTLIQAGINPVTGLPLKLDGGSKKCLDSGVLKMLRLIDEQDAINRGRWINLPSGISSQELERLLYYRGNLCFFYYEPLEKFYFMPYALEGTIDFYKRYNHVHPIPFSYGDEDEKGKNYKDQMNVLSQVKLKCVYDVVADEEEIKKYDLLTKGCVLLYDYSKQWSETLIPRQQIQEPLLQVMSEIIPFMRTSLIKRTGIQGIRVPDADSQAQVDAANAGIEDSAKRGEPYMPVVGSIDFQEFGNTTGSNTVQEYTLAYQALDNMRLACYGIDNGGIFQKKAHELEAEAAINNTPVGLVLQDAVSQRQRFCNIVNSIWGLNMWYEPSEDLTQADTNGDGVVYDRDVNDGGGAENDSNV